MIIKIRFADEGKEKEKIIFFANNLLEFVHNIFFSRKDLYYENCLSDKNVFIFFLSINLCSKLSILLSPNLSQTIFLLNEECKTSGNKF